MSVEGDKHSDIVVVALSWGRHSTFFAYILMRMSHFYYYRRIRFMIACNLKSSHGSCSITLGVFLVLCLQDSGSYIVMEGGFVGVVKCSSTFFFFSSKPLHSFLSLTAPAHFSVIFLPHHPSMFTFTKINYSLYLTRPWAALFCFLPLLILLFVHLLNTYVLRPSLCSALLFLSLRWPFS